MAVDTEHDEKEEWGRGVGQRERFLLPVGFGGGPLEGGGTWGTPDAIPIFLKNAGGPNEPEAEI